MVAPANSHQPLRIDGLVHFSPFTASAKRRLFLLPVDGDRVEMSQVYDDRVLNERRAVVSAAPEGDCYSVCSGELDLHKRMVSALLSK